MINSQDIKKGTAIRMDGAIWVCIDFQHRKPGKGNTIMNIKMKNVTKEGDVVSVVSDTTDGTILYAEMPVKTVLRVTHSEPGIKGDTATNTLKPATLETGVEVRVPLFINEGDLIQVDTRDGSYLARAKE